MGEHDCVQEKTIGEISATLKFFQAAEVRREAREERMADAMESVAAQGETIKSHAESLMRHEKAVGILFERVREIEKQPAVESGKVRLGFINALISTILAAIVAMLVKQ